MGSSFAISAWFRPSTPGASPRAIAGRYDTVNNKRSFVAALRYDVAGTPYQFLVFNPGTFNINFLWNATLPSSGWHHVVFTYSFASAPNESLCYVDGAALTLTSRTNTGFTGPAPTDTGDPVFLGGNNNVGTNQFPWKGDLAQIRLLNYIPSAAEVALAFNAGQSRQANGGTP